MRFAEGLAAPGLGAIAAGGHAVDLRDGLELAREAVDSGAALARLDELIAFSQAEAAA